MEVNGPNAINLYELRHAQRYAVHDCVLSHFRGWRANPVLQWEWGELSMKMN